MVLQRYMVPNYFLVLPMTFIREKLETIRCIGYFTACVLLAYTSASAWLHVGTWYLLIDLFLNHLFSPIHIPQLLMILTLLTHIYILILSFAHIWGLLQVGSPWYNLGFSQKWQWLISLTPDSLLRNHSYWEGRIQTRFGVTILTPNAPLQDKGGHQTS